MKLAAYLSILTIYLSFVQIQSDDCFDKCSETDKEQRYVCVKDSSQYFESSCHLKCSKNGQSLTEVECEPLSLPFCMNECTPEERMKKTVCNENREPFKSECLLKCADNDYDNDVAIRPCEKPAPKKKG